MKTKILIVDDLKENIMALSGLIDEGNVEIFPTTDPNEALSLLLDHEFALALLDVQMPSMSGFELARLIRGVERGRHLPIIFVTAQQREASLVFEGYETGAVDVLFKPLDPHIVRSKVRVFVQLDEQSRLLQSQIKNSSRLKEEAEAANIAKSRFLANMSHEIRTPLTAVLGFADVLSHDDLSPDQRKEYLNSIERNGQLLLRLIDDVLDLSRIEAQKLETETLVFNLQEILDDLKVTLSAKATEKGIRLKIMPPKSNETLFMSDPLRLKQILLNIVGNAIKFTHKGHVSVAVEIQSIGPRERHLKFSISDTGIGLKPFEADKLFQPFVQADNSTRRIYGGTGLGLTISRQLARSLGGDIILSSTAPDRGSCFELTVKVKTVDSASNVIPMEPRSKPTVKSKTALTGKRILVIDDVIDNRVLIERYLVSAGLQVGLAAGGEEAIERVTKESWDALLMDIQMPDMDGYETTRHLRQLGFKKPIVALTAHALRAELRKCLDAGCNDTLTKPVSRSDLVKKLDSLLKA